MGPNDRRNFCDDWLFATWKEWRGTLSKGFDFARRTGMNERELLKWVEIGEMVHQPFDRSIVCTDFLDVHLSIMHAQQRFNAQ